LTAAGMAGAALRLLGYAAQGMAARNPSLVFLLYLLPAAGILIAAAGLRGFRLPIGLVCNPWLPDARRVA
jgi:hypothetical protein